MLPRIVFLDIDQTIIGNSLSSIYRVLLHDVVRDLVQAGELDANIKPLNMKTEIAPVIRPHFEQVMKRLSKHYQGTLELFVCTLGTSRMTHALKIPGIEQATNITFNRPIFCNSHNEEENSQATGNTKKKLVYKCFLKAVASLKHKYPALNNAENVEMVFRERFIMVDDAGPDVSFDEKSKPHIIKCPAYAMCSHRKPHRGIPANVLAHPKVNTFVKDWAHHRAKIVPHSTNTKQDTFWLSFEQQFKI